jgi:hypothetical protein
MWTRRSSKVGSEKREAKLTYEGCTGYQPVLALWAELNVVVSDEFRDGNVPAHQELLPITQRAFQALPETVVERYFPGDSGRGTPRRATLHWPGAAARFHRVWSIVCGGFPAGAARAVRVYMRVYKGCLPG